jgi:hypothetical protein
VPVLTGVQSNSVLNNQYIYIIIAYIIKTNNVVIIKYINYGLFRDITIIGRSVMTSGFMSDGR